MNPYSWPHPFPLFKVLFLLTHFLFSCQSIVFWLFLAKNYSHQNHQWPRYWIVLTYQNLIHFYNILFKVLATLYLIVPLVLFLWLATVHLCSYIPFSLILNTLLWSFSCHLYFPILKVMSLAWYLGIHISLWGNSLMMLYWYFELSLFQKDSIVLLSPSFPNFLVLSFF